MADYKDTLFRQWTMLRAIPRQPRSITTRELKQHLENESFTCSTRTLERDLDKLSGHFGYTLEVEGRRNHWFWPKGFKTLDIPGLEPSTALAFHLMQQHIGQLLPPSALEPLTPYFELAKAVLDKSQQPLGQWRRKIKVLSGGPRLLAPRIDELIQHELYTALLQEKRVSMLYQARSENVPREYEFSPLGIVSRDGVIYIIGCFWEYANAVQIALHRIQSIQQTNQPVHTPPGFDLDAYVDEEQRLSYPTKEGAIELELAMNGDTARHLEERPLSGNQTIQKLDNERVRLTATVVESQELIWWLLGLGDRVEVLAPPDLRRRMREILQRARALYR